jgi:hypothetical protein
MKIKCTKCNKEYEFSDKWFKKHDPSKFICRICKIKKTTQSKEFRQKSSEKSKKALSNKNIKDKMSQIATLNNIKNSDKISKSLKKFYSEKKNIEKLKHTIKNRWKNDNYKQKVSNKIEEKWKNPLYRGKILGSRTHLYDKKQIIIERLKYLGYNYKENFSLMIYKFEFLINGIYLYDQKINEEKKIFVNHHFKKYVYIDNLDDIK